MPDLDAGKPLGTRRWILTLKAGTNAPVPNAVFVSKSLQVVSAADWLQSQGKVSGN
jgi:hypothetical protein